MLSQATRAASSSHFASLLASIFARSYKTRQRMRDEHNLPQPRRSSRHSPPSTRRMGGESRRAVGCARSARYRAEQDKFEASNSVLSAPMSTTLGLAPHTKLAHRQSGTLCAKRLQLPSSLARPPVQPHTRVHAPRTQFARNRGVKDRHAKRGNRHTSLGPPCTALAVICIAHNVRHTTLSSRRAYKALDVRGRWRIEI